MDSRQPSRIGWRVCGLEGLVIWNDYRGSDIFGPALNPLASTVGLKLASGTLSCCLETIYKSQQGYLWALWTITSCLGVS
ncbi:hypothetical protein JMJ77_0008215 [Colletotrichum scovillei]|uniref:Uncharacterized protein n=1 Tax=Colletotrichum scovillei TaxID=1209932 RepID=A0A9P7UGP4_9PEZI|nr:hypothetical protein JMJ77_0008215 [Colletotrichum scovillei]KAG7075207.1 hypothetical protein JMJ76_0011668 [Colletotrichum scovillei]KAG7082490.1 hypothetical protein JMJ78_0004591 [Colletotrichum scovillei]